MTPEEQLRQLAAMQTARKRTRRPKQQGPDLLDVLSGADERGDLVRAQRLAYRERRKLCPDGRPVRDGMTWCGRCGEIIFAYSLVINHDLGYCGCPVEFDPVLKDLPRRPDGRGFRAFGVDGRETGLFTRDELNTRWDRPYFPDCECGDSCGIHGEDGLCIAYCGCHEYRAVMT